MIESIGWFGSVLLATCGFPMMYEVCIKKNINAVSKFFLLWWLIGEILLFIYILSQPLISIPLLFNYGFNCVCILVVFIFIIRIR